MKPAQKKLASSQLLGLAAIGLGVLVIAIDFTALSVALPTVEKDFTADVTTVQWIITGYALIFGTFIVTGGRLADMFGRRLIFFIGAAIFATFSLVGGLATEIWLVLVARGIMGIGAALMWPALLGMAYSLLPAEKAAIAGGAIIGAVGFGNAAGPLLGGFLTEFLSWRWIFYINVPIAIAAILVLWRVIPKDPPKGTDERVDYAGVTVLSLGLFGLLLALDFGSDLGWFDPIILGVFAGSVLFLVVFSFIERKAGSNALVPPDILETGAFVSTLFATLLMSAIFFASLLFLPQFMAKELGFSAFLSGAGLLPVMGMFAATSFISGPLYERIGAKTIVSIGALCLALGMFLLSRLGATTIYTDLIPGMVILGMGLGLFYSSITTAGITALDPSRASLAGAMIFMFQIAGGAIGLGLNTAIVVSAPSLPEGIHRAFMLDTGLAILGLVVCLVFVGGRLWSGKN